MHEFDFRNGKRIILSLTGRGLTVVGLAGFHVRLRKKLEKTSKRIYMIALPLQLLSYPKLGK